MIQLNIYTKYSVDLITGMELMRLVIYKPLGKQRRLRASQGKIIWEYGKQKWTEIQSCKMQGHVHRNPKNFCCRLELISGNSWAAHWWADWWQVTDLSTWYVHKRGIPSGRLHQKSYFQQRSGSTGSSTRSWWKLTCNSVHNLGYLGATKTDSNESRWGAQGMKKQ